jgi:flagellar biosynthesis/type III secretory pathway chaperone
LNAITLKERKLVQLAAALEQQRILQTSAYFMTFGISLVRAGKISDVIRTVANPADKRTLTELRHELSSLLGELKRVNDHNEQLIAQSLQMIRFSIDLLTENPSEDLIYQHPMSPGYASSRKGMSDTAGKGGYYA